MAETSSQGYDNPISLRQDDHLNRWSFAKEVFSIADTAPSEWSVRIGVYGAWGTGKTSALKFIESMAKGKNHVVIKFNPWPLRTTNEMWEELTQKVYQSLKSVGLEMKNHNATMFKSQFRKLTKAASGNTEAIDEIANHVPTPLVIKGLTKTTKVGLSIITGFLEANSQELEKVGKVLGERRIIVFIDDLDRTDLHLLPEVLYALREVLDLPGFVFILGFDPLVIGEALKKHHPGWGDGKRFLEKIIDFPRPLPPPTKQQLLRLAKDDIDRHGTFIDFNALQNISEFLPENPRQLRSFIRSLWGIKSQVIRYESKEINWEILLLINLLKFKQPDLAYLLFQQDEQWIVDWGASKFQRSNAAEPNKHVIKITEFYNRTCESVSLENQQEKQNCYKILDKIVEKSSFYSFSALTLEDFKQLAYLTEAPPHFTFKEIEAVLSIWENTQDCNEIKAWISNHCTQTDQTDLLESADLLIFVALFEKLVHYWDKKLLEASLADNVDSRCNIQVKNVVSLIQVISFDLNGFTGVKPFLKVSHFLLLLKTVIKWFSATTTLDYQSQRYLERSLLEQVACKTTLDPMLLLELLNPWNFFMKATFHTDFPLELFRTLNNILEPLAAKKVIDYFQTEDISKKLDVFAYLILRQESRLWKSSDLKENFLKIVASANTSPLVSINLFYLLQLFAEKIEVTLVSVATDSQKTQNLSDSKLLHDVDIIQAIWRGAISTSLNPRSIISYVEFRKKIQKYADVELTIPDSWNHWLSQSKS